MAAEGDSSIQVCYLRTSQSRPKVSAPGENKYSELEVILLHGSGITYLTAGPLAH